jgi:glycosyltransferase involved in cell wall biosynthesis
VDSHGVTRFVYAGNLGDLQDLETLLRAAGRLSDLPAFRLLVAGTGVAEEKLRRLVETERYANVEFLGSIPHDKMSDLYAMSDFQVITLKGLDIFKGTVPSKFQSSLAQGVPVVTSVIGDVTTIVENERLGFTAIPEDVNSMEGALRKACALPLTARKEMAARARRFYEDKMSVELGVAAMESVLRDATEESRRIRGAQ